MNRITAVSVGEWSVRRSGARWGRWRAVGPLRDSEALARLDVPGPQVGDDLRSGDLMWQKTWRENLDLVARAAGCPLGTTLGDLLEAIEKLRGKVCGAPENDRCSDTPKADP